MAIIANSPLNGFVLNVLTMPLEEPVFEVLNTSNHRDFLRFSRSLTPVQWDALWEKNLPARLAANLVDYDLSQAQLDKVLADEKRGSVLVHQFTRPLLTSQQQLGILTSAKGSQYVYQALGSGRFDPQHIEAAAVHFRGTHRLEWITFSGSPSATDNAAFEALVYCTTPEGYRHCRDTVGFFNATIRLLEDRPQVLDKVMQTDPFMSAIITPLAGSRLIAPRAYQERLADLLSVDGREVDVLAFVANPVVHVDQVSRFAGYASDLVQKTVARRFSAHGDLSLPQGFDTLEDPNHIEWVLRRALPTDRRPLGRPHDLVLLAKNPSIVRVQALRLHAALRKSAKEIADGYYTQSVKSCDVNFAFARLHERFSLPSQPKVSDKLFWTDLMKNGRSYFSGSTFEQKWTLDPTSRPWAPEDVEKAFADIPPDGLEAIRNGDLTAWKLPTVHAHTYMVHEFQGVPRRWELAVSLASTHLGSLAQLVSAVKRLAR